jgi:predicted transcriptional regulator
MLYVRKKLTAIRLKPEQVEKLEKIALREDVPVSWLIRKAIDEFLKRQKWAERHPVRTRTTLLTEAT